MAKMKSIKKEQSVVVKYLDERLKKQTQVIVDSVGRILEKRLEETKEEIGIFVEDKIIKSEERIRAEFRTKMDELANTLDKFLKHLMDFDDEFKIVKARLAKVEKIIEEKLGIEID